MMSPISCGSMSSYARLAKLPPPKFGPVEINTLLRRVTSLETRMQVFFEECPPLTVQGDADQLEQVLINLVRNAVDAAQETGGRVFVRHERTPMTGLSGLVLTSTTGARSMLTPIASSSLAEASAILRARIGSPVAPRV